MKDINISHATSNPGEEIKVKSITLDEYIINKQIEPDMIKIDVEGAEMKVLEGGKNTFKNIRPTCIISTHSEMLSTNCRKYFENLKYDVTALEDFGHELICIPKGLSESLV